VSGDDSLAVLRWAWEQLAPLRAWVGVQLAPYLPREARPVVEDVNAWVAVGLLLACGILLPVVRAWEQAVLAGRRAPARAQAQPETPAYDGALQLGLGVWRALWWRVRPIRRAYRWQVGAYRISTRRKHAGIVGATGSRKSTLAAELVDGSRPTLILTGEPSDPLRYAVAQLAARGKGIYWSPNSVLGWDMLQGDPMETAERLTAGTKASQQDTGLGRGIVQDAVYHALRAADRLKRPRTWQHVEQALQLLLRSARDQDTAAAAKRWLQRFGHMCLALGPALGRDLDIAEALAQGKTVMMEMSSMRSPESTPLVAANILLDGKRAAQLVKGGRLIVDEGWAFKERKGEIAELVRAGRRLGWEVYFLTQLPQDYTDEMLGNFRTWVFLMQVGTNTAALEWCSKAVHRKLPPEAFSEGVLDEGDGWLLTSGRLVKIHVRGARQQGSRRQGPESTGPPPPPTRGETKEGHSGPCRGIARAGPPSGTPTATISPS
jgi:hypothetical protein